MRWVLALVFAGSLAFAATAYADDAPTVANTPPVVVKTEPPAGATDVAASTGEIRVTFSKKMRDKDWSWVEVSKESFPATTGQPHFLPDGTTCILPVKLEAGKSYAVWLNSAQHQNFQDEAGRKAVPYLLVFGTK